MTYIIFFLMLVVGYYTFTYAIDLWKNQNNKLASFGVALIAVLGTFVPIVETWIKL